MKYLSIIFILLLNTGLFGQSNWENIFAHEQSNDIEEFNGKFYCASNGGITVVDMDGTVTDRITKADGLPSNKVEDIEIDSEGMTWIGTYDNGIAVRESTGWRQIDIPEYNQNLLYCMEFDENGILYIGTNEGAFKYVDEAWEMVYESTVWDMTYDDGAMYFASNSLVKEEAGNLTEFDADGATGYVDGRLAIDGERMFWWTDNSVLAEYDGADWTLHSFDHINDVKIANNGDTYVDNGTQIQRLDGEQWVAIYEKEDIGGSSFIEGNSDKLIFGSVDKLFEITNEVTQFADIGVGFSSNSTKVISNEYGQVLVKSNDKVLQYDGFDLEPNVLELPDGSDSFEGLEFVQFPDMSIGYFDENTGNILYNNEVINLYSSDELFNDGTNVKTVLADSYGGYWVAHRAGLLYSYNGENTVYDNTNSPFELIGGAVQPSFYDVTEDLDGNIWACAGAGLGFWNRNTGDWTFYDKDSYPWIGTDLFVDENNVLWGSSSSLLQGLVRFDGEDWTIYSSDDSDLPTDAVYDIYSKDGAILLATFEGFVIFDGTNFETFNIENSGLGVDYCGSIAEDAQGNVWIGGRGGSSYAGISIYNSNSIALGISDVAEVVVGAVKVYPNPTTDFINVDLSDFTYEAKEIQLFDFSGKMVMRQVPNGELTQLAINKNLDSGMYLVKVIGERESFSCKIIVK